MGQTAVGPLPAGPFDVVYADPPWEYDFSASDSRSVPSHYAALSVAEISALPISQLCGDRSVLFLWATAPKVPEALRVVEEWGFRYVTHCVWDKRTFGMGYWFRGAHELLLIASRGAPPPPPPGRVRESVIMVQRGTHSTKPEEFRRLVVRYTPWASRYLELFARGRPRRGWVFWGDQAIERPGGGGRPRTNHFDRDEAIRLRSEGLSWGEIAKRLGASKYIVQQAVLYAVRNPPKHGFLTQPDGGFLPPETETRDGD